MPLYEYKCENDDCVETTFDVLTTFESSEVPRCPVCRTESLKRKDFYQFSFSI